MKAKRCLNCGKVIKRGGNCWGMNFAQRKFCSQSCYEAYRQRKIQERRKQSKECSVCGKIFYNVDLLPPSRWQKKTVCSPECRKKIIGIKSKIRIWQSDLEKKILPLFEGAKVWVNGRLVKDNGWKDEDWWKAKIEKAKKEIRRGKIVYGNYKDDKISNFA